ncbi:adenosine receptor A3-like [Acropora millepora]|uniref:adenosine receptor A3-like n=1 Tax=Acropora millepora TaxID=45264 RepID=UPI001CF5B348|nr:adenosine receptor A3-like [Acropora millepora]
MPNHSQQENTTSFYVLFSAPECISWLTVFGIQAFAIVFLNALVIIIFLKERSLRKRSMYLVINLAVADMSVGGSVVIDCWILGLRCGIWTTNTLSSHFLVILTVQVFLPLASMINLAAISLERTHATFWPIKHRLVKKKVFGVAVAAVWITTGLSTVSYVLASFLKFARVLRTVFLSFFLICLLIIIVSYSSMAIRILCGIQLHRHGATSRERQLTKTLFITTLMSLLLTLPFLVFWIFNYSETNRSTSYRTVMRSSYVLSFFYFTNSIANPVIYACRIPEFKGALYSILRFRSQPQPVQV